MEEVFDLYDQPYDASYSVIGMDEQPKPWLVVTRMPRATRLRIRYGAVPVPCWLFVEQPLGQWAHGPQATRWLGASGVGYNYLRYRQAERLTRIYDQLNTHSYASFLPRVSTQRSAGTPRTSGVTLRHGSWLNRTTLELSVLTRQVLARTSLLCRLDGHRLTIPHRGRLHAPQKSHPIIEGGSVYLVSFALRP